MEIQKAIITKSKAEAYIRQINAIRMVSKYLSKLRFADTTTERLHRRSLKNDLKSMQRYLSRLQRNLPAEEGDIIITSRVYQYYRANF